MHVGMSNLVVHLSYPAVSSKVLNLRPFPKSAGLVTTSMRTHSLIHSLNGLTCMPVVQVGIFDRDPTPVWSSGAVTLLGDAASPIPPHLGQGGNKAMEDAGVLVAALAK